MIKCINSLSTSERNERPLPSFLFGIWSLVIGTYLELGVCFLEFMNFKIIKQFDIHYIM